MQFPTLPTAQTAIYTAFVKILQAAMLPLMALTCAECIEDKEQRCSPCAFLTRAVHIACRWWYNENVCEHYSSASFLVFVATNIEPEHLE